MRKYPISMLDAIGAGAILFLLAGLVWVPLTLSYAKYQDRSRMKQDAMIEAQKEIHADMQEACHCWFTDSRCRAPSTKVVACSMPDFMRHIP